MTTSVKVTISMPQDLLRAADELAEREGRGRSNVLQDALRSYIRERERQEMIKGYQEMAALNRELAEADMAAVNEVWARYD